jgi:hypothetical protein
MKEESDPITDNEWLLRRVHRNIMPGGIVTEAAFTPRIKGKARDPDTNGISLYRESCLVDPTDILAEVPADKRNAVGIVRVSVALLKSLGLTVRTDHDDRVNGHVVIPELNASDYEANKAAFTFVKVQLAEQANEPDNIVKRPSEDD